MNLTRNCTGPSPSKCPDTPTVFVVDSDASVRAELALLIRSGGWQPRTAASAEEFLSRPRLMTPGCLLSELHLPGLAGLDLQRLIVDRRELPIIFMSSRADVQSAVQAMKGGALELLTKPLAAAMLFNAIRHALDHSRVAILQQTELRALRERYATLSRR
ncbi:MAG TPA: response regulator, partial [Edaphobacter sp.]